MAYLDATVLNDFQAKEVTSEALIGNYGMIDLAKDSSAHVDYISPGVKELMKSMSGSRNAVIPVIKDQQVTVNTTPGFGNIPVNLGESGTYMFSAYDVFSGFRVYPASYENNAIDQAFEVQARLSNVLQAMAEVIDTTIGTVLSSRKTQVLDFTAQISQNDGVYTFNTGTDTLEIDKAAQKDTMFYQLQQLMMANKLQGNYSIVTSPGGLVVGDAEAMKFKAGNSKQLDWAQGGMPGGKRHISNQIATSANFDGWLVRDGDIGLIENFPFDFRNNTENAAGKWSISDVDLPFTKMRANIYVNTEATNGTAVITPNTDTNMTMTTFEEMAIWHRFFVVYRYNSAIATKQNAIVKLQGKVT
tara:strand:+ start:9478 stop:10554 length:1077 start_codon:yes stop_codon:yes gene_type:complete